MKAQTRTLKGQIGLENMILLALIGLALIFGLIALWNMGVFEPYSGQKGFVGFNQMVIIDWIVGSDKAVISLKNEGDSAVIVHMNKLNLSIGSLDCPPPSGDPEYLDSSENLVFVMDCPGITERYELGDYFDADLSINFTQISSGRDIISVGKLYSHVEDIPDDWTPPTSVTTTTKPISPQCFYKNCSKPGQFDPLNCGEIWYYGGYDECDYCSNQQALDGQYYCNPRGRCGQLCSNDKQCEDQSNPFNLCESCIEGICEEEEEEIECGSSCEKPQSGWTDSKCTLIDECPYCAYYFQVTDPLIPEGNDLYTCESMGDCGKSCLLVGFDRYEECRRPTIFLENYCPHCDTLNATHGLCKQGDCGKPCGPANPMQECEEGCRWCNYTVGEPSSFRCEIGNCGIPCDPANPMESCEKGMGCETCYQVSPGDYRCVHTDIGISLMAHNGSMTEMGGVPLEYKVVAADQDIYLNATANCETGVSQMIISNSVNITNRNYLGSNPYERCHTLTDNLRVWFLTNGEPDPLDVETELDDIFNITWMDTVDCGNLESCRGDWITSEEDLGQYCYISMAQKAGAYSSWTEPKSDWIQIGYINVYLIYPYPEIP